MLAPLRWALYSPTKYPVHRRERELRMHSHHRKTQIPKCTQTTSLPPSASSLRTELGSRGHPAGWMGLRQISMWHTSESRALPCDDRIHNRDATFHPTAMSAGAVFLDSQVSLGPPASDRWWGPSRPGACSCGSGPSLQLCLHLRTWQRPCA